jgi:tetratricopeptide (TPR) repeat protein
MGAVTYPDERVANFVNNNLIPLQIQTNHPTLPDQFDVKWTPTLITLDAAGNEHHRNVGFLPPEELIPALLLGMGKTAFDQGDFPDAISIFDQVIEEHSQSDSAPEAIFFRGVALYKKDGDPKPLRAVYDRLSTDYPQSEWAKKAQPYKLIE